MPMQNKEIVRLPVADEITYVPGLGFISPNKAQKIIHDIRRVSCMICICLICYFLFHQLLESPSTYIASFLGFDVSINPYTGLITATAFAKQVISFLNVFISLLLTMGLAALLCLHKFKLKLAFRSPNHGVLSVALPICVSVAFLGETFSIIFGSISRSLGLVFPNNHVITPGLDFWNTIFIITTTLLLLLFQEVLFRGIILYSLRRYGDGFAILASSLVYAIFQDNLLSMISSFLFGLTLSYFVVRSSSIYTAILAQWLYFLMRYSIMLTQTYMEASLAAVIISLSLIVLLCFAGLAFVQFVYRDKNAFVLKKPYGNLSLRRRLITFSSTIPFIIFAVVITIRIINRIQIIG